MDIQIFVQNVKHLLDEQGVSYSKAGRESGAGEDFIRNIDRKNSFPSIDKVKKMADYLGVTVSELLGEESPNSTHTEAQGTSTPDEQQLLQAYRSLNKEGQEKLLDLADDLVSSRKYIKSRPSRMGKEA